MRIAITNAFLPSEQKSGVPFQVHFLANALVDAGQDVTVFSFSDIPADAKYKLYQFVRPSVPSQFFPFFMAYRLARADFSQFDVINSHGDNYLFKPRIALVRTFHGSARDEMRFATTLRRKAFFLITDVLEKIGAMLADHCVGVSTTTRASIRSVQTIIPCGVDLNAFKAGTKTDTPTILFVGTEAGRKRGAWLADLFKRDVLPLVPSAELRMVSDAVVSEPGVHRYGRVSADRLHELYGSAWAFCLPSTYEGFGVPYIEAMAANTAVVATSPNPGASEVLADGAYGAFVDDEHLAASLTRILTDVRFREEMERRGLERSQTYSWHTVAAQYLNVFRETIAKKKNIR